mgnify:CR=1 FL=1
MMTKERNYVTANELAETLGVSTGQAYKIIRRLNNELDKKRLYYRIRQMSTALFGREMVWVW